MKNETKKINNTKKCADAEASSACIVIPPQYRCSRCKGDLRLEPDESGACQCNSSHPTIGSKGGDKFIKTYLDYHGYSKY